MAEINVVSFADGESIEQQLEDNKSLEYSGAVFDIKWTGDKATDLRWMAHQDDLARHMESPARSFYGQRLMSLVGIDEGSRSAWERGAQKGLELSSDIILGDAYDGDVSGDVSGDDDADLRGHPPPRYPMITQAIIEFAAQAGEALLSDAKVVKVSAPNFSTAEKDGDKGEEADQLSDMLSWQVMTVDRNWKSDSDRLLHMVACMGTMFRKRWVDKRTGRNMSKVLPGLDVVVNNGVADLDEAPRITERYTLFPYQVRSKIQAGEFFDVDMHASTRADDWHQPIEFWEVHTWLDLDDDGADEPYIITIQKDTNRVVSMQTGFTEGGFTITEKGVIFERLRLYTPYHLIPSFDGSFYSKGFGHLLGRLSDTVDELVAAIIDTAKLNNENGGVIGRIGTGMQESIPIRRNELTVIPTDGQTLQSQIVMFPTKEVPASLFSVLSLLTDAGQRLSSTVNLLEGATGNMPATTAMAIVDQGARIYSAILQRQWRSMGDEFTLLYDMNRATMKGDMRYSFEGREGKVTQEQFQPVRDVNVSADPRIASSTHRAMMSGYYAQFIGDPATNQEELRMRMHKLMKVPQPEALIVPPQQELPPDIKMEMMEAQSKIFEREVKAKLVSAQAANELLTALTTMSNLAPQLAGSPEIAAQFTAAYAIMQKVAEIGATPDDDELHQQPAAGSPPFGGQSKPPQLAGGPNNAGPLRLPPPPTGSTL